MLKVNNFQTTSKYYNSNNTANKSNSQNGQVQSFGSASTIANKAGNWMKEQINISSNGSLTRAMFFLVGVTFMLGGRLVKSRDKDEAREVVTRDVPAVFLSVAGAPFLNKAMAYGMTKLSGIPIMTLGESGKIGSASLATQKQIIDWYSDLGENALVNFSKTVDKNGGNLTKAFKKLGFTDKLTAITTSKDNKEILNAINDAKANGTDAYKNLETAMKGLGKDNALVKFAKNSQAGVKLTGLALMAGILGYFLPHLNIVVTRNKYAKKLDAGQVNQAEYEKRMMRTSPVFRVSSGVLSFHKTSAEKTFKNLLDMVEGK